MESVGYCVHRLATVATQLGAASLALSARAWAAKACRRQLANGVTGCPTGCVVKAKVNATVDSTETGFLGSLLETSEGAHAQTRDIVRWWPKTCAAYVGAGREGHCAKQVGQHGSGSRAKGAVPRRIEGKDGVVIKGVQFPF